MMLIRAVLVIGTLVHVASGQHGQWDLFGLHGMDMFGTGAGGGGFGAYPPIAAAPVGGGFGMYPPTAATPLQPDPAARDAQITAAEEQMAEAMSETPRNSPERQRIDRLIQASGGRFTGDAVNLNYLVQEYVATSPGPSTPPPPETPVPQSVAPLGGKGRQGQGARRQNQGRGRQGSQSAGGGAAGGQAAGGQAAGGQAAGGQAAGGRARQGQGRQGQAAQNQWNQPATDIAGGNTAWDQTTALPGSPWEHSAIAKWEAQHAIPARPGQKAQVNPQPADAGQWFHQRGQGTNQASNFNHQQMKPNNWGSQGQQPANAWDASAPAAADTPQSSAPATSDPQLQQQWQQPPQQPQNQQQQWQQPPQQPQNQQQPQQQWQQPQNQPKQKWQPQQPQNQPQQQWQQPPQQPQNEPQQQWQQPPQQPQNEPQQQWQQPKQQPQKQLQQQWTQPPPQQAQHHFSQPPAQQQQQQGNQQPQQQPQSSPQATDSQNSGPAAQRLQRVTNRLQAINQQINDALQNPGKLGADQVKSLQDQVTSLLSVRNILTGQTNGASSLQTLKGATGGQGAPQQGPQIRQQRQAPTPAQPQVTIAKSNTNGPNVPYKIATTPSSPAKPAGRKGAPRKGGRADPARRRPAGFRQRPLNVQPLSAPVFTRNRGQVAPPQVISPLEMSKLKRGAGTTVAPVEGDMREVGGQQYRFTDADGYDVFQWILYTGPPPTEAPQTSVDPGLGPGQVSQVQAEVTQPTPVDPGQGQGQGTQVQTVMTPPTPVDPGQLQVEETPPTPTDPGQGQGQGQAEVTPPV